MGLKVKNILLLFCFLGFGFILKAQTNLNYFLANTTGTYEVLLSWEIDTGFFCSGTKILRSADGINFSPIGEIQGLCGSSSVAQRFSFTDTAPVNFYTNYYKLELGTSGFSHIISIYIVNPGEKKAVIFPNPVSENSAIYIDNQNNENLLLEIRNLNGSLVYNKEINSTMVEMGSLIESLQTGSYLLFLYRKNEIYFSERIIIP